MGAYDTPERECPYCNESMEADFVDVGVGMVQCGPYHCESCGASEIGPEWDDWCYKDREGNTIYTQGKRTYYSWRKGRKKKHSETNYSKRVIRFDAPVTTEELETGYYRGRISPYANTVGGELVDHITAKEMYNVGLLDEKNIL
ncbi:hypothetical protein [Psychrobacillus sp. BM2]|uniref:hypothetical protein n=1 Tax=Psychrobacillus sp. BM2 TaxID=3400421 RepID=UPI003B02C228